MRRRCRDAERREWARVGEGEREREREGERRRLGRPREAEEGREGEVEGAAAGAGGAGFFRSSSPLRATRTGMVGRSDLSTGTWEMRARVSWPETRWPKTVCLAFRCSQDARVMKNLPSEMSKCSTYLLSRCLVRSHGHVERRRVMLAGGQRVLTAVGVLSAVRHAHQSLLVNRPPANVFVLKLAAVDGLAASSVAFGDVPALDHELVDDAVERRHLVGQGRPRSGT